MQKLGAMLLSTSGQSSMIEHWIVFVDQNAPLHLYESNVKSLDIGGTPVPVIECRQVLQGPGGFLRLELSDDGAPAAMSLLVRNEYVLAAVQGSVTAAIGFTR